LFQNAFIGNDVSNIHGSRDSLAWQQCSENCSLEFTIKLPFKVISSYSFCICLIKTMMEISIHDLFHMISATTPWPISALDCISGWHTGWYGKGHVLISMYHFNRMTVKTVVCYRIVWIITLYHFNRHIF
jgi:hypothetical protein